MSGEANNTMTKSAREGPSARAELSPSHVRIIEQSCDQFESAIRAGSQPTIRAFVQEQPEPVRSALLKQLVLLDWEYQQAKGVTPQRDDYRHEFPHDHQLIDEIFSELTQSPGSTVSNSQRSSVRIRRPADQRASRSDSDHVVSSEQRYERDVEIGRGGIGVVDRGWDRLLNRPVAIKYLRDSYRDNREAYQRFTAEAQICSRLQHPAIIPVYDLSHTADQQPFFVMKLIEGRTLGELLKQRTAPNAELSRFLGIFEQVCQAVAYAHTQRIVHRDLKPANVMVGPFGEVQVMDWGFAKQLHVADGRSQMEESHPRGNCEATTSNGKSEVGHSSATHSGAMMGTPAYMSPEQARGQVENVDLRSDVFSLGAILCEILTGEPPFRGSADSICAQAAAGTADDANSRLSQCGMDRELCELAQQCLQAERDHRPADAGIVAARITSYLTSSQERLQQAQIAKAAADARAEQLSAKVLAERRARRFMLGLTGALALLFALAGGAYWWQDRVQREDALRAVAIDNKIEAALTEANESVNRKDWVRANTAALRAKELLGPGVNPQKRESVAELVDDLNLVKRMDLVLTMQARFDPVRRQYSRLLAVPGYEKVFLTHKLAPPHNVDDAVARIAKKPPTIREAVIAGLDNWRMHAFKSDTKLFSWIDAVLQQADTDEWRCQTRAAVIANNRATLIDLAARDDAVAQSPVTITMLAWALGELGEHDSAVALLRKAVPRYPSDFWINMEMARAISLQTPYDAAQWAYHYKVAWSLRPESISYVALSIVFNELKDYDNMVHAANRAIALNPKDPSAHYHLGIALSRKGRTEESELAYRKAVELDGKYHLFQFGHGVSLVANQRYGEGAAAYERAIQSEPNKPEYYYSLGIAHEKNKNLPAAVTAYRKATELKPDYSEAHCNLGIVLGLIGRIDESITSHETALRLKPAYFDYWNNLGGARHKKKQYDLAIAAFRRAIELDPNKAIAWENLGIVMNSKSDWAGAIRAFREALRIDPDHGESYFGLGVALMENGEFKDGLAAIRSGRQLHQDDPQLQKQTEILLKKAERLVEMDARLPAVVARELKPASMDEMTEFARLSSRKGLTAAAADLFAEVLATRPTAPISRNYYEAIRSAAWAGCGKGKDAPKTESERQKWRDQAYAWLRADLEYYRQSGDDSIQHRETVQKKLRLWRTDRGLNELRELNSLARLAEPERKKWLTFWAEVDAALVQSVAEANGPS